MKMSVAARCDVFMVCCVAASVFFCVGRSAVRAEEAVVVVVQAPEVKAGLGYFAEKVRKKEPVLIGYIGGSITVGSGSSTYANNYYWVSRSAAVNEIVKRGGSAKSENVGIGGTGSEFGAFRIGAQLLVKNPDLLVIEFAVNDGGSKTALQSMEGIVRQALRHNPKMGIIFFYTTSAKYEKDFYAQGKIPPSVEQHHTVAQHYGITEVNAGPVVHKAIVAGTYTVKECFPDTTHPSDIGHGEYGHLLGAAIVAAMDLPLPAGEPVLPALLGKGEFEYARLNPVYVDALPDGWKANAKQWNWYGVNTLVCEQAGKPLRFPVSGSQVSLVFLGNLMMHWQAPGGEQKSQKLNGRYGMPFPATWRFSEGALPVGTIVTVEAIADTAGKVKGEVWGYFSLQAPAGTEAK